MKSPPTTIHAVVCSSCGFIVRADTRAEAAKEARDCPQCPINSNTLAVHRYQLAPQKSRNARKSRAR